MRRIDGTSVRTLRLRAAIPRSPAARLASTAVLAHASLEPADLPRSSILVIRSLEQRLPRGWRPSLAARPPQSWYQKLSERIRALRARAVRPWRGMLPSDAEAVLFTDESEAL